MNCSYCTPVLPNCGPFAPCYPYVDFHLGPYSRKVLDLARLKSSHKVKTFVSAKFCLKTIFTKGDLAKSKIVK